MTVPARAATTLVPASAAMSIPRCMPPAYGRALSFEYIVTTRPRTGHVHPSSAAARGAASASMTTATGTAMIDLRNMTGDASAPRGPRKAEMILP